METYLEHCFNWFVRADIYDVESINHKLATIHCIISTEEPVLTPENWDDIMWEQLKKPYIDQNPPETHGVKDGFLFDITNVSFVGQEFYTVEEYYGDELDDTLIG